MDGRHEPEEYQERNALAQEKFFLYDTYYRCWCVFRVKPVSDFL